MRRLLAEDREARAYPSPVGLAEPLPLAHRRQIDRGGGAAQAFRVVAAVEMLPGDVVERHLLRADEILQAELDGVHLECTRNGVEQHLQREAHSGTCHAAIGEDRRLVGRHRPSSAPVHFEDVGTGQDARDLRRLEARRERIGGVRAGIDMRLAVDGEQSTVVRGVAGDDVVMLAAVGVGGELLSAVLDPPHRMVSVHRDPSEHDLLGEQDTLVAESAADVGDDDAHLILIEPETLRESGADDVRHLARGMEHEHPEPPVPVREHPAALDRRHALARGAKRAGDGYRGLASDSGQVAIDHRLEKHVVAPLRMQQRRIRSTRVEHVGDGGELFEVERHAARQILRRGPRFSHAGGDQLAGVADAAGGEHRLLGDLEARQAGARDDGLHSSEIGGGEDSLPLGTRGLGHAAHPCVRERAAHERHVHRAGHRDVGDELAAPVQQPTILLAWQACPDASLAAHRTFLRLPFRNHDIVRCLWNLPKLQRIGIKGDHGLRPLRPGDGACPVRRKYNVNPHGVQEERR